MWFAIDSNDPDVRGRHVCVLLSLALSIWSRLPECCSNSLPVISPRLTAVTRHKESSISTARRRLSPACALHQNHSIKPPREKRGRKWETKGVVLRRGYASNFEVSSVLKRHQGNCSPDQQGIHKYQSVLRIHRLHDQCTIYIFMTILVLNRI